MGELWTVQRLLTWTTQYFKNHGIEEPRLDAELLLAHVLGRKRIYLYTNFDEIMNPDELARYRGLIQRRVQGYCTAALIGERDFMGLTFHVNEKVLIPRPDTETWVEKVIQNYRNLPEISLLDLGTGSGAIAVSFLAYCKGARAVGVDLSEEALAVARDNAEAAGVEDRVEWRQGDYLQAVHEGEIFDVVLSNPPYIPSGDIPGLSQEVRHEPVMALDGGADGLAFYRLLAAGAGTILKPGGLLAAEVGIGQAGAVQALFAASGDFEEIHCIPDYGGIDRAVCAKKI